MTRRSLYGAPAVRVQVLLTEQQAAQIAGLARARGTTSAAWMRETVIEALGLDLGYTVTDTVTPTANADTSTGATDKK